MEILIDEDIRNWVFIPILVAMIFFSLIKQKVMMLLKAPPMTNKCTNQQSYEMKVQSSCLLRAKNFEQNHNVLTKESFQNRQTMYCKKDGLLSVNAIEQPQDMASAMQNSPMSPDNMSKMMGGSMAMMVLFPLQMYDSRQSIISFDSRIQTSPLERYKYWKYRCKIHIITFINQDMDIQDGMMMPPTQQPPNPLQQAQGNQNQKKFEGQIASIKTLNHQCIFDNIEDEFLDTFEDQLNQFMYKILKYNERKRKKNLCF